MLVFSCVCMCVFLGLLWSLFVKEAILREDASWSLLWVWVLYAWPVAVALLLVQRSRSVVGKPFMKAFCLWQGLPNLIVPSFFLALLWFWTPSMPLGDYYGSLVLLILFPIFMMPVFAFGAFAFWFVNKLKV